MWFLRSQYHPIVGGEQQNLNIQIRFPRETPEEESAGQGAHWVTPLAVWKKLLKKMFNSLESHSALSTERPAVIVETRNMNELKNYKSFERNFVIFWITRAQSTQLNKLLCCRLSNFLNSPEETPVSIHLSFVPQHLLQDRGRDNHITPARWTFDLIYYDSAHSNPHQTIISQGTNTFHIAVI